MASNVTVWKCGGLPCFCFDCVSVVVLVMVMGGIVGTETGGEVMPGGLTSSPTLSATVTLTTAASLILLPPKLATLHRMTITMVQVTCVHYLLGGIYFGRCVD